MNRPDIAAFVLGCNAMWLLTAAALMTLMIRRNMTNPDASTIRDFLVCGGVVCGVSAIGFIAWWLA